MVKKQVDYSRKTVSSILDLPVNIQEEIFRVMQFAALIWNVSLKQSQEWLAEEDKQKRVPVTYFSFTAWLAKSDTKQTKLELSPSDVITVGDISSNMAREVCRMLAGSWSSFFELRKEKDRSKTGKQKDKTSMPPSEKKPGELQTLAWQAPKLKVVDGQLCLVVPTILKSRLNIPVGEYLEKELSGKMIKDAKLRVVRHKGRMELKISVVYAYYPPKPSDNPMVIRAIDLGAGDVAVCESSGDAYLLPMRRPDKHWDKLISSVEKRVKTATKGSRRWKRRMNVRRRMHNISSEQRRDFQRKLALALLTQVSMGEPGPIRVRRCDAIVLGESLVRLGLARNDGTANQHKGVQNTGYMDRLARFIKEKAEEYGIRVLELPDPPRTGRLTDKMQKLGAAALLLRKGAEEFGVKVHEGEFTLKPKVTFWI